MKKSILLALSFLCVYAAHSQMTHLGSRSVLNPQLYPFYHGVASGDPLSDRVIIWTRISTDNAVSPVTVNWQLFSDTTLASLIQSGSTSTDSTKDFTVKVDVSNLQPNTWYYYRFSYDTFQSVLGRTRTLPVGAVNNLRFAVASCQDYQSGYYNAHRHLAERNDVDAVLFLGDYTYEDAADNNPVGDRFHEPDKKTVSVLDYRLRQSLYHLDPDLQAAHQQYPWIAVWDDHETTNNSYTDSAKNHNVNDGPWYTRKTNAVQAYNEWMPIRTPDIADTFRIFRRFTWGDLLDLYMIDTRLYDRDRQAGTTIAITNTELNDSTRTMVGPAQFSWLVNNMQSSTAQWQILGQQVMMTPLVIPAGVLGADPFVVNGDQWDGYPYERQRFYDFVLGDSIRNVVVLTGDIHTAWANDLPLAGYDTANRSKSVGVEFVAPSITSGNELPPLITAPVISSLAPHVRYVELVQHGYYVLDVTPQRTQADFIYVSSIESKAYTVNDLHHYCVSDGETWLNPCGSAAVALNAYPPLAEMPAVASSIRSPQNNITALGIQPNPFQGEVQLLFHCVEADELQMTLTNMTGALVLSQQLGLVKKGLNYLHLDGHSLPAGSYLLRLSGSHSAVTKSIIKLN
ncbi:MAG: alkaline phosphatase D family protein [Bacteroidetes bacterium]|nr:alkaline phosphatase D family protein [Bacteroidota bacterium]